MMQIDKHGQVIETPNKRQQVTSTRRERQSYTNYGESVATNRHWGNQADHLADLTAPVTSGNSGMFNFRDM